MRPELQHGYLVGWLVSNPTNGIRPRKIYWIGFINVDGPKPPCSVSHVRAIAFTLVLAMHSLKMVEWGVINTWIGEMHEYAIVGSGQLSGDDFAEAE